MWIVPDTGQAHARGSHFGTPCYFPEIHGVQSCFTDHSLMYVRDKDMNVELRAQVDPRDLPRNWFCSCNPPTTTPTSCEVQPGEIRFWGSSSRVVGSPLLPLRSFLSFLKHLNIQLHSSQHNIPKVQLHWGDIKFWGLKWKEIQFWGSSSNTEDRGQVVRIMVGIWWSDINY